MDRFYQPIATIIGALLVITGVYFTIRDNRKRLQIQRLEQRAAKKFDLLREYLGQFAAAGYEVIEATRPLSGVGHLKHDLRRVIQEQKSAASVLRADKKTDWEQMLREIEKSSSEWEERRGKGLETLGAAYGRLAVFDDLNDDRSVILWTVYSDLKMLDGDCAEEAFQEAELSLTRFLWEARTAMEAEYRDAARLAERGVAPVIPIRTESPLAIAIEGEHEAAAIPRIGKRQVSRLNKH